MSPDRAVRLKHWGQCLKKRIDEKQLNQSEFASKVAIFTRDKRMGRDLISNYIRGIAEPSSLKQIAMAKALGIEVDELMAPLATAPIVRESSVRNSVEMHSAGADRARLTIDKEVSWEIAVEILRLINSPK
jgi:transcriptional regulator with XRE-family HTH domain